MSDLPSLDGIALLTPTFLDAIERFAIQRESIMALGTRGQHFVVVNTEDRQLFDHVAEGNTVLCC